MALLFIYIIVFFVLYFVSHTITPRQYSIYNSKTVSNNNNNKINCNDNNNNNNNKWPPTIG